MADKIERVYNTHMNANVAPPHHHHHPSNMYNTHTPTHHGSNTHPPSHTTHTPQDDTGADNYINIDNIANGTENRVTVMVCYLYKHLYMFHTCMYILIHTFLYMFIYIGS